jgi:hypothetical protein
MLMLDPFDILQRAGVPDDSAAPMHVVVAANRCLRVLSQMPGDMRAGDVLWALRLILSNAVARIDIAIGHIATKCCEGLLQGARRDGALILAELERG